MKFKSIVFFFILCTFKGFSNEEKSIEERIQYLEEKRGFDFKKRKYRGIVEGELLYWKADVDGVAYATTSITEEARGAIGTVGNNVKTRTPHFSYDPGFRLGLGVQSPYDLFDFVLVWTRFYTKGHDSAEGSLVPAIPNIGDKLIFDGIGLIKNMISIPNSASAECRIRANLLDLQLARGIEVSRHFFMRPYFGIRGVWSDVDWDINVKRSFIIPGIFDQDSTELKVRNNFQAVGGLVGLNLDWKAPMGFGINMHGAGALVWGLTEEKTKQKYLLIPAASDVRFQENFKATNSSHSVKGLWELFAGVFWETHFPKEKEKDISLFTKKFRRRISLRLLAGYEFQQWPYVGQKTNTQINRQRERFSLGFQGFTGGARLIF